MGIKDVSLISAVPRNSFTIGLYASPMMGYKDVYSACVFRVLLTVHSPGHLTAFSGTVVKRVPCKDVPFGVRKQNEHLETAFRKNTIFVFCMLVYS